MPLNIPIQLKPHQNAKGTHMPPYRRQKASTVKKLTSAVQKPKSATKAMKQVYQESGGIQNVRSGSELPRNVQQLIIFKRNRKLKTNLLPYQTLTHLQLSCSSVKQQALVHMHTFVLFRLHQNQYVSLLLTSKYVILYNSAQTLKFSVLTVDPTFNLGPFNVTPMTYENLLVNNKEGKHPLLLGPVLIHQTKTLSPFHLFASTLISLNGNTAEIKAFGSDGEPELIKAFSVAFRDAVQLCCFSHFRQNIKDKLQEIGMHESATKTILDNIFGRQIGSHFEEGLVDAEEEKTFWSMLDSLEIEWSNLERGCYLQKTVRSFFNWFKRYKAPVVAETMLRSVRKKANLGTRPCQFTTNHSESINSVMKTEVEWKESHLPQLVEKLHDIHTRQMQNF